MTRWWFQWKEHLGLRLLGHLILTMDTALTPFVGRLQLFLFFWDLGKAMHHSNLVPVIGKFRVQHHLIILRQVVRVNC